VGYSDTRVPIALAGSPLGLVRPFRF
jgi:hypothetical protein